VIVTTQDQLQELAAALAAAPAIALDTEFMRERTYRAELCLIQVSGAQGAACVDPLTLLDLSALSQPLTQAPVRKIMHSARQDLEVLLPTIGFAAPVFDTQIAAGLAGFAPQIGYGELARRLLGVELAKAHTRTDWSRRPLSPEQIAYALDDVRHLAPMANALEERLRELGRLAWLTEDLRALADPRALAVQPEDAWRRIRGLNGLDAGRLALLKSLGAWRETRAITRNRPRGWILDDLVLREIVVRVPRTPTELSRIPEMPDAVVKNCGDELLALVSAAGIEQPLPPLQKRERPDPVFTAAVKRLTELTSAAATELGIAAELLATRRELEQVASGKADAAPLHGWRREVVGTRLLAAL
jgi:ribonuclease D